LFGAALRRGVGALLEYAANGVAVASDEPPVDAQAQGVRL